MHLHQAVDLTEREHKALAISAISRSFEGNVALQDISLAVAAGEIICLVGHSGCGKTTLLKMISGIDKPDSGTVHINGQLMAGPDGFTEPERRRVGVVFQDYALFPHLTVKQNILFGLRKTPRSQAAKRVAELLELVGLSVMADRYPHMLSGGEQQRVALARALAPEPDILLMDEPFSNLDQGLRYKIRSETIGLLRKLGTTVIIVTHDGEEALSTGDRLVLMRAGQIEQSGTPSEIYDHPETTYVADFFCKFNSISGNIDKGKLKTPIGEFSISPDIHSNGAVRLYLRPHHIQIIDETDNAPESSESIEGTIIARDFMGDTEELLITTPLLENALRVRTDLRLPRQQNTVRLVFDTRHALIFPKGKQDDR